MLARKMLTERAMKYTHFELKNIAIQKNKFPRLIKIELYRTCFSRYSR